MAGDTKEEAIQVLPKLDMMRGEQKTASVLTELENEVLESNLRVFADASKFAEIDPADPATIPPHWIIEHGLERAKEMHRTASYALMSAKEAPVGLQMAKSVVTAAIKGHAERSTRIGTLNIGKVFITGGAPVYEEIELEPDDER